MTEIARTPHWIISVDDEHEFVRVTRTPLPFASIAEIDAAFSSAERIFATSRSARRLLMDLREAPSRNDDHFESALGRHRNALFGRFERVAILVKTAVGKLHVQRLAGERQHTSVAFFDEAEALAFLVSPD